MSRASVALSWILLLLSACQSGPGSTARGIDLPTSRVASEPSPFALGAHRTPIRLPSSALGERTAAELAVRVLDPSGVAVESARVTAAGRTVAVDAYGDGTLTGLEAGSTAVIRADADGYLGVVRRVESLELGLTRTTLVLTPIPAHDEPRPWELSDWVDLSEEERALASEDGSFEVVLPETLLDARGDVYEGLVDVVFATYETHGEAAGEDPLAASPGPLLADAGSGSPDTLMSLGMFNVEITSEDGEPLTLGEPARVRRAVPAYALDGLDLETADVRWWHLDPDQGLWIAYDDDGVLSYEEDSASGAVVFEGELPHFCAVNLDLVWTKRTESLVVAASEIAMRGAEVRLYGQGMDLRVAADAQMSWKSLPPGELVAELYVYDALVDGPILVSDADDAETSLRYDEPVAASGEVPVTLRLRNGDCPSDADEVTFTPIGADAGEAGETRAVTPVGDASTGRSLLATALPAGEYEVNAWLSGRIIGRITSLVVGDEPVLEDLEASAGEAVVPAGGCRPLPCEGAACDSALRVSARDANGAPTTAWGVRLDDGDAFAVREDVCIDLPGAADRSVTVIGPTGAEIAVDLPRGASCDELVSAAEVTLVSGETCVDGAVGVDVELGLLGPEDPRFYSLDARIWPGVRTPGVVSLHAEVSGSGGDCGDDGMLPLFDWRPVFSPGAIAGLPPVASACQADLTLSEGWGWISAYQEADGSLTPDGIHLRAAPPGCTGQTCEAILLDLSGDPGGDLLGRSWDSTTLEDLRGRLTVTLHVAGGEVRSRSDASQSDQATTQGAGGYDIPGLTDDLVGLTVSTNGAGEIVVSFEDVEISSSVDEGGSDGRNLRMKHNLVLNGVWTAPMLSSADFPSDLAYAETRAAYGVSTKIVYASGEQSGGTSVDDEAVLHCAVEAAPFYVRAVGGGDTVTGLSPLLVASGEEAQLWSGPLGMDAAALAMIWGGATSAVGGGANAKAISYVSAGGAPVGSMQTNVGVPGALTLASAVRDMLAVFDQGTPLGDGGLGEGPHDSGDVTVPDDTGAVTTTYVADGPWSGAASRIDRAWLTSLYVADGWEEEALDASASVLASPSACQGGDCTFTLTLLDGTDCGAVASPAAPGAVAAFLGLDETCGGLASWDNPFLLRWSIDDVSVGAAQLLLERGAAAVVRGGDGLVAEAQVASSESGFDPGHRGPIMNDVTSYDRDLFIDVEGRILAQERALTALFNP